MILIKVHTLFGAAIVIIRPGRQKTWLRRRRKNVGWLYLAQDSSYWRSLMNTLTGSAAWNWGVQERKSS